jgi:hypothetical protein
MRTSLSLALAIPLAACGNGGSPGGGGGGGGGQPDADMGSNGDTPAFEITSKDVTLQPGQEVTYCYYFHTPNAEPLAVSKWTSDMAAGSHHVILFFGDESQPADGTLTTDGCGVGAGPKPPMWIYASQTLHGEIGMPPDDGTGKPLAMVVPAHQAAYLQIHYLNSSDAPINSPVTLDAYAYAAGTAYTQTAPLITYNTKISIAPHAMGVVASETCSTPEGAQFWLLGTHSHKQSIMTDVKDGATMLYTSNDWEHPPTKLYSSPSYLSFASGKLTYECTYDNTGSNADTTIVSGPSAATNEMCMALGYFFPATGPKFCFDSQGPF